jgi:predicted ATPase/DNA-binding winged helix-turn-helix (wHTH) protein
VLHIDPTRRTALWQGQPLPLNDRAFDLLLLLARQPGDVVAHDVLARALWPGRRVDPSNLRVQVATLRRLLGDDAVRTVTGRGYLLALPLAAPLPQAGATDALAAPAAPLPGPAGGLIGRDACLQQLGTLLQQHRLVSILGPGGIGKTRVALQLARHARGDALPGGLVWLDLAPLDATDTDPAPLCRALADAAHLQWDAPAGAAPAPHLGRVLHLASGGAHSLLVLDNAEHLKAPLAALLPDLLAAAPALRVLVTSQHALPLAQGQAHWLAPLDLPAPDAPDRAIARSPAVQLLLRRAQALQPSWQPAQADWPAIGALARALDGLPLALELAAARLPLLGPAALLAGLAERLLTLAQPAGALPPRQRTLQAALAWSFGLLAPVQQAALCQLAVLAAPFRLATAVQLLGDSPHGAGAEATLQALVEQSMLQLLPAGPHGAPARLRLADTTRLFALQAVAPDVRQASAHRHSLALAALARAASQDFFSASDAAWQAHWGPDQADLQRAFDHAHARGDADTAADLIEVLVLGANITGATQPALQRWQATRDLADAAAPPARAKLLGWGNLARAPGSSRQAQSTQRVQAWRQVDGDAGRRGLCVALAMHAAVCQDSGDPDTADTLLAECQALEAPDWPARQRRRCGWYALTRLAIARDDTALLARAGRLSARLAAELQQVGAWREHTLVQGQQALMLRLRGEHAEAAALLADAAAVQHQLGCGLDAGRSLGLQAAALADQLDAATPAGQTDAAALLQQACATGAHALALMAPYPAMVIEFSDALAGLAARCGQPELAAQLLAATAQQRVVQQKGSNRLVAQAAQRAWQRVHRQLDGPAVDLCTRQGQALSADGLRLLALRGLAAAASPVRDGGARAVPASTAPRE